MTKEPKVNEDDFDNGRKACSECGQEKDRMGCFDKDGRSPDGFKNVCRECRKKKTDDEWRHEVDSRIRIIDEGALKALETLVDKDGSNRASLSTPHLATLMQDVANVFGGTRGYAQHLLAQFLSARPGSLIRLRILELIERVVREASKEGYVDRPLTMMDDEEVEKLVAERRSRMIDKLGLTVMPATTVTVEAPDGTESNDQRVHNS